MAFGHHTPEFLLPRSDSKNPATTCRGITNNGRPCRRPLAASPSGSPAPSPSGGHGVLAVLQGGPELHINAAAFFCWQHKDQADQLASADTMRTKLYPLKEKSSIDTLVDRLGVLDLEEDAQRKHRNKRRKHDEPTFKKRDTMPAGWHDMQSPLMTVPEGFERPDFRSRTKPNHGRSNLKASFLCCLRADDDDIPPSRKRQDYRESPSAIYQKPQSMNYSNSKPPLPQRPPQAHRKPVASPSLPRPTKTQSILSLISPHLPPQTLSALVAELSRPLTKTDLKTYGYIYIFWLTPETEGTAPDSDIASTILDSTSPGKDNVQDQLLQRYSSQRRKSGSGDKTILLKIGRATNVHRRLAQWSAQCGHHITLLRYYPYSSNSQPIPLLPRVERLIQLELAGRRVKQEKCGSCGREHREWFEVEASRRGVRGVDECVRRWMEWAVEESGKQTHTTRGMSGGYY